MQRLSLFPLVPLLFMSLPGCSDGVVEPDPDPDPAVLQVMTLDLWPGNLLVGRTATVEGRVANMGGEPAGTFSWRILVDGVVAASGEVHRLGPGETADEIVARGIGPFEPGFRMVVLEVDPGAVSGAQDPKQLRLERRFQVFEPGFAIDLRIIGDVTPSQEAAFQRARQRWEQVVLGALEPTWVRLEENECNGTHPAIDEEVDDLLMLAIVKDGGATRAGPCVLRDTNLLAAMGVMYFRRGELEHYERVGRMDDLILHEMGHVLGIGSGVWQLKELLVDAGGPDPHFIGPRARQAFSEAHGGYAGSMVPVENEGGPGTRDAHWRWRVFTTPQVTELMTPLFRDYNPLSGVTIGALEDIGYAVDISAADPYVRWTSAGSAGTEAGLNIGDDVLRGPVRVVRRDGSARAIADPWLADPRALAPLRQR